MIFLDTSLLFAYASEDDEKHRRVCEVMEGYRGRHPAGLVLTTNHVVGETITLVRARGHREPGVSHDLAVRVGEQLLA